MLSENRLSKYLLYAIGEIILFTIGIFLAIQLNNWNDDRKSKEKIDQVFEKVQAELLLNIQSTTSQKMK
ncbi:MAG: hypothetical protein AAF487_00480, partial [Bacteroidota bacterium]